MPKTWSFQQQDAWDAFNRHYAGRGSSHAVWALLAVESLFYVADLDDDAFATQRWYGASSDAVDIAHVTAATGNAFSALDRCAASLADIHGVTTKTGNAVSMEAPSARNRRIRHAEPPSQRERWSG